MKKRLILTGKQEAHEKHEGDSCGSEADCVSSGEVNSRAQAVGANAGLRRARDRRVAVRATAEGRLRPRLQKKSESMRAYWREVKAGRRERQDVPHETPRGEDFNPLLALPDEKRGKLFAFLRDCPYQDAVRVMLRDFGVPDVTKAQCDEFYELESELHWEVRIGRAAVEADALVRLAEKSKPRFSAGILAALGQEAFRQIASGQVDPSAMGKLATLFMKARSEERVDQMQELKREKLRHELEEQVEHALEKLAEEVERHPGAREAFEALRRELALSDGITEGRN